MSQLTVEVANDESRWTAADLVNAMKAAMTAATRTGSGRHYKLSESAQQATEHAIKFESTMWHDVAIEFHLTAVAAYRETLKHITDGQKYNYTEAMAQHEKIISGHKVLKIRLAVIT